LRFEIQNSAMPSIHEYVDWVRVLLEEAAKYFALLLFAVLAIRFWRRAVKVKREKKPGNILGAIVASVLACLIGYFSIRHSMSLMYSYFGMRAFQSYKLEPALSLFQTTLSYWKDADALGGKGVCLLWTGSVDDGIRSLNEARALRRGKGSPFENFYEGLYYFYHDDVTNAVPRLEAASAYPGFGWDVTKLFAVIQLDRNQPQEAVQLMQPFLQVEVTEADQAYVIASLNLADGKKAEAQALVDKFLSGNPTPFWKAKLEKLREKIQGPNP
jgi:tetratricopeptide (TPR) repeat protein